MALIQISNELREDRAMLNIILNAFDTSEPVSHNVRGRFTTYRVQRDEVPVEDKVICPEFIRLEGVDPFVIDFGI